MKTACTMYDVKQPFSGYQPLRFLVFLAHFSVSRSFSEDAFKLRQLTLSRPLKTHLSTFNPQCALVQCLHK
jgi:hypothetical protein